MAKFSDAARRTIEVLVKGGMADSEVARPTYRCLKTGIFDKLDEYSYEDIYRCFRGCALETDGGYCGLYSIGIKDLDHELLAAFSLKKRFRDAAGLLSPAAVELVTRTKLVTMPMIEELAGLSEGYGNLYACLNSNQVIRHASKESGIVRGYVLNQCTGDGYKCMLSIPSAGMSYCPLTARIKGRYLSGQHT